MINNKSFSECSINDLAKVSNEIKTAQDTFNKIINDYNDGNTYDYDIVSIVFKAVDNLASAVLNYAKTHGYEKEVKGFDNHWWSKMYEDLYIDEMKSVCF